MRKEAAAVYRKKTLDQDRRPFDAGQLSRLLRFLGLRPPRSLLEPSIFLRRHALLRTDQELRRLRRRLSGAAFGRHSIRLVGRPEGEKKGVRLLDPLDVVVDSFDGSSSRV